MNENSENWQCAEGENLFEEGGKYEKNNKWDPLCIKETRVIYSEVLGRYSRPPLPK